MEAALGAQHEQRLEPALAEPRELRAKPRHLPKDTGNGALPPPDNWRCCEPHGFRSETPTHYNQQLSRSPPAPVRPRALPWLAVPPVRAAGQLPLRAGERRNAPGGEMCHVSRLGRGGEGHESCCVPAQLLPVLQAAPGKRGYAATEEMFRLNNTIQETRAGTESLAPLQERARRGAEPADVRQLGLWAQECCSCCPPSSHGSGKLALQSVFYPK